MKQLLFMIALELAGTIGAFVYSPFLGVFVYYLFAVLRPQNLWDWSLSTYGAIHWSLPVAIATILSAAGRHLGFLSWQSEKDSAAPKLGLSTSHLTVLFFGGWVILSYLLADNYHESADGQMMVLFKVLVMFMVSAHLLTSFQQLWMMMVMAAAAMGYIAYEINLGYLVSRSMYILKSGYGGLDNNGIAIMLAMGLPLCLFVWEGSQRWWRWLFAAFIPVLIHAVLLTYSRGAMVALLVGTPFFWLRSRHKKQLSLAFVGVALMLPIMAGKEIRERFFSIERYEEDHSAQERFAAWQAGWEIALDHPFFGVGFRNSHLYMQRYGSDENRAIHSLYLQIAADSGLVALGLYLLALLRCWWGTLAVRPWIDARPPAERLQLISLVNGVECSMIVFCAGALFLSLDIFEFTYLLMLLAAQLPVLVNARMRSEAQAADGLASPTQPLVGEPARMV